MKATTTAMIRPRRRAACEEEPLEFTPLSDSEEVDSTARKSAWARLLARVYQVDPLICPQCDSEMKVTAVIQDIVEIKRILRHLVKIGGGVQPAPPALDESSLN